MSQVLRSKPVQKLFQLFHYHFLSEKVPGSTLGDLDFDTNIRKSLHKFRNKQWKITELVHYGFLAMVIFFVFIIFPASFLIKIPLLAAFCVCFLVPLTSQFFLYALPIFTWLALFFSASKIPHSWKPAITVKFLPAMETILYGDNLSNVLAETNNSFLDIMAWLPYGVIHFASPFFVALFIFLFAPPTSLRSFGFAFGYMNLTGVFIQLLFPAAPPWYKNIHGLEPANYSMNGSPGGLGRIDKLFGGDMYTTTFENSPLVFGAFPSLHSGCAVMDVLFLCWLFPRFTPIWWSYAALLWWSTMYLTHHYFIDLIFGAALSVVFFTFVKYAKLPVIDQAKFCRWSYSELKLPNSSDTDPLNCYIRLDEDLETGVASNDESLNHTYFNEAAADMFEMSNIDRSRDNFARAGVSRTSSLSPGSRYSVPVSSDSVSPVSVSSDSISPVSISMDSVSPDSVSRRISPSQLSSSHGSVHNFSEAESDPSAIESVFDRNTEISVSPSDTSLNDMLASNSAAAKSSFLKPKTLASG